ncbi:murein transglycosylase A [Glacieibacterium megasporae]|uniref:murein transglycosylase A n=1 Tax=Glacieibacterium megasporae TaxID=2835787 RepID=UPI0021060CD0|nr:murein transglycosylase A [Polymorphobacter megasporae]
MTFRLAPLRALAVAAGLVLAGCAGGVKVATVPPAPSRVAVKAETPRPTIAFAAPLASRPGFATADFGPALTAFRRSCPALLKRTDASGLTLPGDWTAACAAAATATDPRAFFATALRPVVAGDGRGLDTGYFEPELAGSRTAAPGFAVPLYRRPLDLIDLDLGTFDTSLNGKHVRGRIAGKTFVPYFDRAAIDDGALTGRSLELAWAADPYEAFFLEIQGSGRLRLPDGTILRVGYDGQNGHAYTAIGKLLRDRGVLAPGQATMDGIIGWMRSHPADGRQLMRANRSYVFFRVLTTPADLGPTGAIGVPLTPRVSVAADPKFVVLGGPVWLDTTVDGAPFRNLVVAQDTGGAIKGANRLDVFWGAGAAARATAGGLSSTGSVTLLLPAAAAERLVHGAPPAP